MPQEPAAEVPLGSIRSKPNRASRDPLAVIQRYAGELRLRPSGLGDTGTIAQSGFMFSAARHCRLIRSLSERKALPRTVLP